MYVKAAVVVTLSIALGSRLVSPSSVDVDLTTLARQAVAVNATDASTAIAALRDEGPSGLQALIEVHADQLKKGPEYTAPAAGARSVVSTGVGIVLTPRRTMNPAWQRLSRAIDEVGQQRDNWASRLYWYTDLAQAKAAARASGKPILALRLLGKLNEEYSCANSRLFRTALYPNAAVSQYLRDHYVLYWQTVRPVPRVTIDFGDGRRIETTITGNSIHYVLDSECHPLEALPGMTGPQAFLRWLTRSSELAKSYNATADPQERRQVLRDYHQARLDDVNREWAADVARLNANVPTVPAGLVTTPTNIRTGYARQTAVGNGDVRLSLARPLPVAQRATQSSARLFTADASALSSTALPGSKLAGRETMSTDVEWAKIAQLHMADAALDETSTRVINTKEPSAWDSSRVTMTKMAMESPMMRVMLNFQRTVAEDTVYNEYVFHSKIHQWFTTGAGTEDAEVLNKKVYAQLFLTPDSDPWLGLMPRGVFTGLPYDGVIVPD